MKLICILLLMATAGWASNDINSQLKQQKVVEKFARKYQKGRIPYAQAIKLGAGAVKHLDKMLKDKKNREFYINIITTIGFIGSDQSAEVLDEFMQYDLYTKGEKVPVSEYQAKSSSLIAMGYVVNKNGKGLGLLKKVAEGKFFPTVLIENAPYYLKTEDEVKIYLREKAIMGLGVSGHPQAKKILDNIYLECFNSSDTLKQKLLPTIRDVLNEHSEVASDGLEAYYEQTDQ